MDDLEALILTRLNLHQNITASIFKHDYKVVPSSKSSYAPPPTCFIKFIFNRCSKGNLGIVGFDGIFQDSNNNLLHLFAQSCGFRSNNLADFLAVEEGILIPIRGSYVLLQVDGDSQVVIKCIQHLLNGKPLGKIVWSLCLKGVVG